MPGQGFARLMRAQSVMGHWTAYISDQGVQAEGIDLVPEFVEAAAARFPELSFRVGDLESLPTGAREASAQHGVGIAPPDEPAAMKRHKST